MTDTTEHPEDAARRFARRLGVLQVMVDAELERLRKDDLIPAGRFSFLRRRWLDGAFIVVLPADVMPARAATACRNAQQQMRGDTDWFSWVPAWLDQWATKLADRDGGESVTTERTE